LALFNNVKEIGTFYLIFSVLARNINRKILIKIKGIFIKKILKIKNLFYNNNLFIFYILYFIFIYSKFYKYK